MSGDRSDAETEHAYERYFLGPQLARIVEKAQRADHAAQNVDREHYAHFRRRAFEFRKMAREGTEVTEDVEPPETEWPPHGTVTHGY